MNERIKELISQAQKEVWGNSPYNGSPEFEGYELDTEKFAELILKDVFQHLTDTGHDYCREILEKRYDMVDPRFAEYLKEQYERTN